MKGIVRKRFGKSDVAAPRARWDRTLALTLLIGISMLVILGLVFSVAQGSRSITQTAGTLHVADESLRSGVVVRAQATLALHMMTVDRALGTDSSEAMQLSMDEASEALAVFSDGVGQLSAIDRFTAIGQTTSEFEASARSLLSLLAGNDLAQARAIAESTFATSFDATTDLLVTVRDELAFDIDASDALLGRLGNIARFLVAFLIPAAIVIIYRALLRRQQRQAELESRLENERLLNTAREAFVANASHELRTPLTSIVGMSLLLAETDAVKDDDGASELLNVIVGESDDLARMVEDLLTTARLDAGALHYAYQDLIVEEEIEAIADPLQRSGLDIGVDAEPGAIRADRLRFRQLLRNLISNARKYGGPQIRIEGRVDGNTYVCSIVDDGDGIPEELVPRLFKRFIHQGHQTATKDSVGLGLSIVHALAHGMGGSVGYERRNNETYFSLRLPLAKRIPEPEAEVTVELSEMREKERTGVSGESPQIAPEPT